MHPDETAIEHVGNALQLLHNLRTYVMSSAESFRHKTDLDAIEARLRAAQRAIKEGRAR